MSVLWSLSGSHGGWMASSTLVHFLAGSCARDALASGREFTFREAMSSRFTRDIQSFKYTFPMYQSDFSIESVKANIMSTYESLKQQIPQHKSSLSEPALVFGSVPEAPLGYELKSFIPDPKSSSTITRPRRIRAWRSSPHVTSMHTIRW